MTFEGLGEVFKGDSADMCARKFPLVLMGGRANSQVCADSEGGPPSAQAEFSLHFLWKNQNMLMYLTFIVHLVFYISKL
jgi:hypothetical protein